jgi:hypothetical protein
MSFPRIGVAADVATSCCQRLEGCTAHDQSGQSHRNLAHPQSGLTLASALPALAHSKLCGSAPRAPIGPKPDALNAAENCAHFAARRTSARMLWARQPRMPRPCYCAWLRRGEKKRSRLTPPLFSYLGGPPKTF